MASFWFHLALIMVCFSSLVLNSKTSNSLPSTNPPPSSFQELSPEITPLLPSPGGVVPTPSTSSVSTIPSNPSPPNPDDPEPAFSAFAPMPAATSSASTTSSLYFTQHITALAGLAGCVWIFVKAV